MTEINHQELIDPRTRGFNYSSGWGSTLKPPIYHQAAKVARALGQRATEIGKRAWDLEMAIRNVRLATLGVEKAQAVVALEVELAKHLPRSMID